MIDQNIQNYSNNLKKLGIRHKIIEHPIFHNQAEALKFTGTKLGEGIPTLIMKAGGKFLVVLKRDDCRLDIEKIKQALGIKNLRMATKEEFIKITNLPVGAARVYIPDLQTLIDKKVFEKEYLTGGSGNFTCSIRYKTKDLVKIPGSQVVDIAYLIDIN